MYKFLNKNIAFQSLLLIGLLGVAFYRIFGSPDFLFSGTTPLETLWPALFQIESQLTIKIIFASILLLELILLIYGFRRNDFSENLSLFPAIFYLAISLSMHGFSSFSLPFVVNLFVIIILLLNINYSSHSIKNRVFISGILIGILTIIEPITVLLLAFVIGSLIINKFSSTKDILVTLFGFSIPAIYLLSYYFMIDRFYMIGDAFSDLPFLALFASNISHLELIKIISITLISLYIFFYLRIVFSNKLILMRRRLLTLDLLLLILFIVFLTSGQSYPQSLLYLFVPISYYFSLLTCFKSKWLFHDILILAALVLFYL